MAHSAEPLSHTPSPRPVHGRWRAAPSPHPHFILYTPTTNPRRKKAPEGFLRAFPAAARLCRAARTTRGGTLRGLPMGAEGSFNLHLRRRGHTDEREAQGDHRTHGVAGTKARTDDRRINRTALARQHLASGVEAMERRRELFDIVRDTERGTVAGCAGDDPEARRACGRAQARWDR